MEKSENPSAFPTREELIAGGRPDLAEEILKEGGWLSYGWTEPGEEKEAVEISEQRLNDGFLEEDSSSSSSGDPMEMEAESGIEGILSRLEKERRSSFAVESRKKRLNGDGDRGDAVLIANRKGVGSIDRSSRSVSSDIDEQLFQKFKGSHSRKGISPDVNGTSTIPTWKTWSLQRTGNLVMQFEGSASLRHPAEVVTKEGTSVNHNNFNDDVSVNRKEVAWSVSKIGEKNNDTHIDTEETCQNQVQRNSLGEQYMLSDKLEFMQTEIMNVKNKLRSIRAKLAIQRGKKTHAIIKAENTDMAKKKLDASVKALHILRSTCIVWSTSASEVLLAGSFDGWTNQRRMEKSKSGMFTLNLMLYPGRYEIKFIVDGVWMIDPLRPTVGNNGYENNLLVVS
ncbi:uncharacterized protein LOC109833736 isoform X2 [Asparagus officinalis]|uniref:uncharacterized protein LOC109833736 isoform X2 n=1 Tax=Asparagus officinalis TaxID=4686 RepID=UPI00098E0FC6|nr:uncharacterized protein LOC109833736 isoform X2 [Asparagus officinalis]